MAAFYDYPALYDAIHLPDTPSEIEGLLKTGLAGRLLEPACGTGRHLAYLKEKGIAAEGYDINRKALAFARRRGCVVHQASMTDFTGAGFDGAYSLIGSFRHLLTEADALKHLKLTARSLKPGGLYVVGLDLVDYDENYPDEEGWEVVHRGRTLKHLYETLPPDRRRRRERLINFIMAGSRVLQDEYDLRSYDLAQWKALIAKSPFRLEKTFAADGKPLPLDRSVKYALFALRLGATLSP